MKSMTLTNSKLILYFQNISLPKIPFINNLSKVTGGVQWSKYDLNICLNELKKRLQTSVNITEF